MGEKCTPEKILATPDILSAAEQQELLAMINISNSTYRAYSYGFEFGNFQKFSAEIYSSLSGN